jgi:hypothetical protein
MISNSSFLKLDQGHDEERTSKPRKIILKKHPNQTFNGDKNKN